MPGVDNPSLRRCRKLTPGDRVGRDSGCLKCIGCATVSANLDLTELLHGIDMIVRQHLDPDPLTDEHEFLIERIEFRLEFWRIEELVRRQIVRFWVVGQKRQYCRRRVRVQTGVVHCRELPDIERTRLEAVRLSRKLAKRSTEEPGECHPSIGARLDFVHPHARRFVERRFAEGRVICEMYIVLGRGGARHCESRNKGRRDQFSS